MKTATLTIAHEWNGAPLPQEERARLQLASVEEGLRVAVRSPYYGDPAPPGPAGSFAGLWEFEVVELFLLGEGERYLEVELGPRGHHLVLELAGSRNVVREGLPIEYRLRRPSAHSGEWMGEAVVSASLLPPALRACNAYAIHGAGEQRRYLALHPVPGDGPDFHRLECFRPLEWQEAGMWDPDLLNW